MSRVCTVCQHPDRASIDAALVAGEAKRRIASQYGLIEASVRRHEERHLSERLAKAQAAAEVRTADRLLGELGELHAKALALLTKAERAGELRTALAGIREARGCLELEAKIRGEIDDRPQVNILLAPEWLALRQALMTALAPYPAARVDVAAALVALEGGGETYGHSA